MANSILTSPDKLLLLAISRDADRLEQVEPLLEASDFTWKKAFYVAESNRSALFVAQLLEDADVMDRLDEESHAYWREVRGELEARTSGAVEQVRQIGELMQREGIRPLLYKGPDFQARFYAGNGQRTFSDIDIIVRKHEVEAAEAALLAAGYRPPAEARPLEYYRRFHLHAIYSHPERLPVELHWALDSPYSAMPDVVPQLMEAAGPCSEEFGPNVLCPSPLDTLAQMVIHLEKHVGLTAALPSAEVRLKSVIEGFGLVWVLDVVQWMRRFGDTYDEATTLGRMRALAAERGFVIAIRLAEDLDSASLPAWARTQAQRLPHGTPWISRVLYPDFSSGVGPTPAGERRREFLNRTLPGLGFRPLRLVEALLPSPSVPGVQGPPLGARLVGAARRVGLGTANLVAIATGGARRSHHDTTAEAAPRS